MLKTLETCTWHDISNRICEHWPDGQRRSGSQNHDKVGRAVQCRCRRGQLDGWKEPPTTGREHRQHPVLRSDGEDVTKKEDEQEKNWCESFTILYFPQFKHKDKLCLFYITTQDTSAVPPTCSLQQLPLSWAEVCSSLVRLWSIAAGWASNPQPPTPRSPLPRTPTAPCSPTHIHVLYLELNRYVRNSLILTNSQCIFIPSHFI